jgi:RNA recognition motif-containing protein
VESVKITADRFSRQSKGFGFVEMATSEEAQKAITALNGHSSKAEHWW